MTTSSAAFIHRRPDMAIEHPRGQDLNRCDLCGAERPEYYIEQPVIGEQSAVIDRGLPVSGLLCRDHAAEAGVDVTDHLEVIRQATGARRAAEQEWRRAIQAAVALRRYKVTAVAEAAGISRERVYQIRDGRR